MKKTNSSFHIVMGQFTKNKAALAGLVVVAILILISIFAPVISPYDYTVVDPINAMAAPSKEHIFGLDIYGRDMLARILYGGRTSLIIGAGAVFFSLVLAIILGTIAGYYGGWVDNLIMRCCDIIQNMPYILLAICISQAVGNGIIPLIVAISTNSTTSMIRLLRATMLNIREQEYIEAAVMSNCSKFQIMFMQILPNSLTPIIVSASMAMGMKIMAAASLSFIGLGIQEPIPEWGAMISQGRLYLRTAPHLVLIPGVFVALVVFSFNMVGDGLRDALDPKLRK